MDRGRRRFHRGVARLVLPLLAVLAVTAGVLVAASVASASTTQDWHLTALQNNGHGAVVEFGDDAVLGAGERSDAVVALGGDVIVHGAAKAAVAIGGDVIVDGSVEHTIVSVGGDVRLLDGAQVGVRNNSAQDTAIVLIGGELTRGSDVEVRGDISSVRAGWIADGLRVGVWDPIVTPYRVHAVVPWFVQTIILGLVALIVAVTMPRQVRAVADQLRRRTWAALGWGALTSFIILPIAAVILAVTVIGLIVVLPGVFIGLPLTALFAGSCVAIFVGSLILSGSAQRDNLALAALIGVALLSAVRFIPFVGALAVLVGWLLGLGAIALALGQRQRARREERRAAKAATAAPPWPTVAAMAPAAAPTPAPAPPWPMPPAPRAPAPPAPPQPAPPSFIQPTPPEDATVEPQHPDQEEETAGPPPAPEPSPQEPEPPTPPSAPAAGTGDEEETPPTPPAPRTT